jgi:hypothetical protein
MGSVLAFALLIDAASYYGPSHGESFLASCTFLPLGYDFVRDISRSITLLTFVLVFWWPLDKRTNLRRVIWELVNLSCIPLAVHLVLTLSINFFSPLGGGF